MTARCKLLVLLALVAAVCAPSGAALAQGLIGGLYVTTDPPGAAVYVDGEIKGVSPCGIADVGVGQVEVKAVLQGYADALETVEVKADETTQVELPLRRLGNVGSIAVLVEPPGSAVRVDRVFAGRTPVVVLNVRAGTHNVTVDADGYQPHYVDVPVAAGRQAAVTGKLRPGDATAAAARAAARAEDLDTLGVLDPDDVPLLSELDEGRAFAQVRALLERRKYAEALGRLDTMAADNELRGRYSQRIGRERRSTRRLQELTAAAYEELARGVGEEFVLSLRKGVRLSGKLVEVTDTHVSISVAGTDVERPLADISAAHVIRLASRRFDSSRPANQITFALLYAAEGEFTPAYERLRKAAGGGQAIASARSYVDAERLWSEAVRKDARARAGGGAAAQVLEAGPPVPLLIDTHRGRAPPPEAETLLRDTGLTMRRLETPLSAEDAAQPGVLLICDPGGTSPVTPYDRQEAQRIVDFVRRGGGLIFVGARRPVPDAGAPGAVHPFAPLLRWCGIAVRLDELAVSDEAPEEYPKALALSFPAVPHPVVQGVARVAFPIASPSLGLQERSWGIVRTSPLVGSKAAREASPAVVAARVLGKGRVVVLASWPILRRSAWQGSGVYANDAQTMLRNAAQWVAYPCRQAMAQGE